jgi:hypothetical protein
VKFEGYADKEANEYFFPMEVPTTIKSRIRSAVSRSDDTHGVLTEDVWNDVCAYLAIFHQKLPELQEEIDKSKFPMMERVMGVDG